MAEGPTKNNPDAADFIPRDEPSTNSNWRSYVNRNWSRQSNHPLPYQSQPPMETNHENPVQKLRSQTSSSKTSERCQQGSTHTSSDKPLKHHSFQNQRWQRSRSERSHNRNHSRQPLSDASVRPSFGGGTPLGDWRIRTREPSDLCSSESEKEVGSADSRGAKPKRLTHVSGGSLRGPRDRIRHSYDREKRFAPKQSVEDMFENIPPRDAKSVSSKVEVFKTRLERNDGVAVREEKQKPPCSSKKTWHEPLDWNKAQVEKVVKPIEPHGSKTSQHENTSAAKFASKDKKPDRGKESCLSNTCQEPKHHGHWGSDGNKYSGRKHLSQTQDQVPKKSMQQGWNRPWNKNEVPKNKETHTGSLIEQLTTEKYECMVCCEVVRVMAPVWSCKSCYHVFHLNCIKKWARSPASQAEDGNSGWRCPACQNVSSRAPSCYICFCGKVNNPEWNRNEIPHSCGELCRKKRSGLDCSHPCNILCHPGPCPSCPAFVTKSCQCGKTSHSVRCGQSTTFHCANVCGNLLNCGEHSCTHVCHAGKCQSCQQIIHQACYCGGSSRDVPCGTDKDNYDGFGNFSCQKHCGKKLNCGKHGCTEVCHPQPCQPCPRLPQIVRFCPCGQTPLSKLLELGCIDRKICTDPIPSCGKTCGKPLPCGSHDFSHTCESLCHEGDCGSCSQTTNISCRCSFTTKEVPCSLLQNEGDFNYMCGKRCNKKRQCGRHKCNEICCVDTEHKCSLICGHKLNCGLHRCDEPCHRGNCQNCWQTSFDELTCYCGEAVIFPPVPCGTRPPECKKPCTRQHECDHPVFHSCHSEKKCPPCTYLTQKWCMGKHEIRNNIPCHLTDISCGLRCNQLLKCGMHKCKRICHKGECLINEDCKQPCALQRPDCGHPCMAPCHPAQPCPPSVCSTKVELQCECGRRKESVVCSVASSAYQRITAITMATKLTEMQLGDSVDIGRFVTKKEIKQTRLQCDEECMALERNRRLAEALNISENSDPFNTQSGSKYTDSLKEDARKDLKFVYEIEKEIKTLVDAVNKGKQTKKSHCFPPMNRDHRKLIHDLAEFYCVESVSYDSEPKRNVVITAIKGKSMCPNVALMTVLEREIQTRPPPPIAHYRHQTERSNFNNVRRLSRGEPSIDYFDVQD